MNCDTIHKKTGEIIPKRRYESYSDALTAAKRLNNFESIKIKRQPYKCKDCGFYHVGTGITNLRKVEKDKVKHAGIHIIKVVDKIDLSLVPKRRGTRSVNLEKRQKKKIKLSHDFQFLLNDSICTCLITNNVIKITYKNINKFISLSSIGEALGKDIDNLETMDIKNVLKQIIQF